MMDGRRDEWRLRQCQPFARHKFPFERGREGPNLAVRRCELFWATAR
jgi:hypothetical protein